MGILSKIFTWWDGATIGTALFSGMNGQHVGTDGQGNKYYQSAKRKTVGGLNQRWVIYNGANDASRVPAEWHGWLHHSYDELPESHLPAPKIWEVDYTPNATGTVSAYRPQGALERGGVRAAATGDYEAWTPEGTTGA
ncbi:MAG: NADH:ubiquinone oxidoreductase subunit NDUFA12 [Croceibacterium sp.]